MSFLDGEYAMYTWLAVEILSCKEVDLLCLMSSLFCE
jgi:heme exporter protein D